MAVSAQNLIDEARERADFTSSTYFTDPNLLIWCRQAYRELYDLMVEAYGANYFATIVDLPITQFSNGITALSPLLLKTLRIGRVVNSIETTVRRLDIETETIDYNTKAWGDATEVRATVLSGAVIVQPVPVTTETLRLWYVPQVTFTSLASNIDTAAEHWLEYIVVSIAIKMRIKEESDTTDLEREKLQMRERIVSSAAPRDISVAQRAFDVRGEDIGDLEGDWGAGWP